MLSVKRKLSSEGRSYEAKCFIPTPGIEPGPPGWEPGILATRPCRMSWKMSCVCANWIWCNLIIIQYCNNIKHFLLLILTKWQNLIFSSYSMPQRVGHASLGNLDVLHQKANGSTIEFTHCECQARCRLLGKSLRNYLASFSNEKKERISPPSPKGYFVYRV